jgi:hypothetical protein
MAAEDSSSAKAALSRLHRNGDVAGLDRLLWHLHTEEPRPPRLLTVFPTYIGSCSEPVSIGEGVPSPGLLMGPGTAF